MFHRHQTWPPPLIKKENLTKISIKKFGKILKRANCFQTLEDIERLRKIFATNPNFCISDFQGIVAEDGQFYIIDPQDDNFIILFFYII
jgi:extradiol dioxygenase family protein